MATAKKSSGSWYAWTNIVSSEGSGEDMTRKTIKAGESVSEGDFSPEDWEQLVEARSVRTREYPDMPGDFSGSPREFMVKQVTEQLEAAEDMLADEVDDRQSVATGMTGEPPPDSGKDDE